MLCQTCGDLRDLQRPSGNRSPNQALLGLHEDIEGDVATQDENGILGGVTITMIAPGSLFGDMELGPTTDAAGC